MKSLPKAVEETAFNLFTRRMRKIFYLVDRTTGR